ncbi:MAG: hypothetical protein HQK63_10105 [Desulfamplus sp.]|nr:hypothetical protein [Desulfamplus sp.]
MQQAKFNLTPSTFEFLCNYKFYGFKNKTSMIHSALMRLKEELELNRLKQSADLYTEVYDEDNELQILTETAIQDWPE